MSSSSSTICSQGAVLATAMAVSGTVILLAINRLQKHSQLFPLPNHHSPDDPRRLLRPCISSSEGGKRVEKKKKKRVRFAKDVVEPRGDGERFRRKQAVNDVNMENHNSTINGQSLRRKQQPSSSSSSPPSNNNNDNTSGNPNKEIRGMPANRVALYNGILRDRLVQRLAYSC